MNQRILIQILKHSDNREASDKFGNESKTDQVDRLNLLQQIGIPAMRRSPQDFGILPLLLGIEKSHRPAAHASADHLIQPYKCASAYKQNIRGIDRREFLMWMFAPALGGHVRYRSFQNFQQSLLNALAGNVPGDRRVFVFTANLVDLIYIDDAGLATLHIPVGILQQAQNNVLNVLANVAGFGQSGGIHDRERHIQDAGQRLGEQSLARSRRADQQNVRFRKFDVAAPLLVHLDSLVVIVNGHREFLLCGVLTNHVLIQVFFQFKRLRQFVRRAEWLFGAVIL